MIDLQWYQWLVGAVAILGLSPAPWIAALLTGRLMTLSAHVRELNEKDRALVEAERRHDKVVARLVEERNYERDAKDVERERSDKLADKLGDTTEEFGTSMLHLLRAFPEVNDGQH